MKVLVVDDERVARRRLLRLLEQVPDVEVVGEAADGEEALRRIDELDPDVVLLDIRMPGLDGLELVARRRDLRHVIFTTAYEEFAVKAFEASAVDYLLKPIRKERLAAALEKVRRLARGHDPELLRNVLREVLETRDVPRIAARRGTTLRVFDARKIERFTADRGYTIFRSEPHEYVLEETLASLERRLGPHGFLRVHRSELVNVAAIRALLREDDDTLAELASGETVLVSRRQVPVLKRRLGVTGD